MTQRLIPLSIRLRPQTLDTIDELAGQKLPVSLKGERIGHPSKYSQSDITRMALDMGLELLLIRLHREPKGRKPCPLSTMNRQPISDDLVTASSGRQPTRRSSHTSSAKN